MSSPPRTGPPDASFAVPATRAHPAWDVAGLTAAAAGSALLAITRDPVWAAPVVLASLATALGTGPAWRVVVPAGTGLLGCAAGLTGRLAQARSLTVLGWLSWVLAALVLVLAGWLARTVLTHLRSERAEVDRALAFAADVAVHDPLTGLSNRRGLGLLGAQILESARRRGDAAYSVVVDVDDLTRVNDTSGPSAGDDVLLTVAEALRLSTRATDVVARWGDGQFVVVGPGTGLDPLELERRVRLHCVESPSIERQVWPGRVTAGGAVLEPWDDGTLDTLLRLADREMHVRRALRREAGSPYRPTRIDPSPRPPNPRHPGNRPA